MTEKPTYDELAQRVKELEHEAVKFKDINEDLRVRGEYLNAILDNTNLPIYLKDSAYRYILINREYERLAHITREEICGKVDSDIFPEPVAALFRSQDEEVKKQNALVKFEETIPLADGEHTFITSKFPLNDADGKIYAIAGVCTDITDINQAKEALSESEARYRNLFQYSSDGIFVHDLDGNIIDVNQKALEQSGFSREEILSCKIMDLHPPEMFKKTKQAFQEILSVGFVNFEILFKKKNNEQFPAEVSASLLDVGGRKVVQGVVRDISERKNLEQELLKVQKLESTGILAGGIAHDFNNLLTAILGNICMAKRFVKSDDQIFAKLTNAEKASIRARDLTRQLLVFSKGGAPVKRPAFITGLIKDSASFALSGSNVNCDLFMTDNLWPVIIDEGQIGQVIQNVVKNADQAMPDGGTITICVDNMTVTAQDPLPLQNGRYVKVTIKDKGVGILKKDISKVFDPYFSTKQAGSGLGLAGAYSIIKNHDGLITVESKYGTGSIFHIYLLASEQIPSTKNKAKENPLII